MMPMNRGGARDELPSIHPANGESKHKDLAIDLKNRKMFLGVQGDLESG
jgi:hypothetical protein